MINTSIPCQLMSDQDIPIVFKIHGWQFWNKLSEYTRGLGLGILDKNTEFICDCRSGPHDYHAEWHRYDNGKYKLLIASHSYLGASEHEQVHVIKEVDSMGELLAYCATNIHPHCNYGDLHNGI